MLSMFSGGGGGGTSAEEEKEFEEDRDRLRDFQFKMMELQVRRGERCERCACRGRERGEG